MEAEFGVTLLQILNRMEIRMNGKACIIPNAHTSSIIIELVWAFGIQFNSDKAYRFE